MPRPTTVDVGRATSTDVPTIGRTLAHAFQDDPVFAWIVPEPEARRERLPDVFTAFAELYLSHDETHVAGDGLGAALWAPAGAAPASEGQLDAFGARLTAALGDDAERALELDELLAQHHPEQDCAYLQFMGVRPSHQGRGVGSELLTTMLQRCDTTGTPAYLEATSVDNRRLYRRHGFEVTGELTLPRGPSLWRMWRAP